MAFLPEVNRSDAQAVLTIPLFDPFWEVRTTPYLGPVHPQGSPRPNAVMGDKVLAYFSLDFRMEQLVEGLRLSGLPILAHLPDVTGRYAQQCAGSKVKITDKLFKLAEALPDCGLVIHACSLGMCSAAVYAGVPQVGFFQHDEGLVNSRSLQMSQTGIAKPLWACPPEKIAEMLNEAYRSRSMREYSVALSERYAEIRDTNPMDKAAQLAVSLLNRS